MSYVHPLIALRRIAFLLERESKESILRRFELPAIERYFPDYPTRIAAMIGR